MKDEKFFNRIFSLVPLVAMSCWLSIGIIGTLNFGEIPIYGKNPDPSALGICWLNGIALLFAIVSFFSIPASIILTLHLVINRVPFEKLDYLSIASLLLSTVGFFYLKFKMTSLFNWIMD